MIQRIQSVYLLLAGIVSAFTIGNPIADFKNTANITVFTMTTLGYKGNNIANLPLLPWGVLVMTLVMVVLPLYIIFKYKNRKKQITLCNVLIACVVFYFFTYGSYSYYLAHTYNLSYVPGFFIILPALTLLLSVAARKAIAEDERKIKEADRIR